MALFPLTISSRLAVQDYCVSRCIQLSVFSLSFSTPYSLLFTFTVILSMQRRVGKQRPLHQSPIHDIFLWNISIPYTTFAIYFLLIVHISHPYKPTHHIRTCCQNVFSHFYTYATFLTRYNFSCSIPLCTLHLV